MRSFRLDHLLLTRASHEPLQEEYIQSRQWFEIKTLWYLGRYDRPLCAAVEA